MLEVDLYFILLIFLDRILSELDLLLLELLFLSLVDILYLLLLLRLFVVTLLRVILYDCFGPFYRISLCNIYLGHSTPRLHSKE